MKLIYCPHCADVMKLDWVLRTCKCGDSQGCYDGDGLHAIYSGDAIPLGFENSSLAQAIRNQPDEGWGERFEAFVIPKSCPTFKRVE